MKTQSIEGIAVYTSVTAADLPGLGPLVPVEITVDNMQDIKGMMAACDQATEVYPGCVTWGIIYDGGQRGQMTIYPKTGRAALCLGGDSIWGDWSGGCLHADSGEEIWTSDGELVADTEAK
jgi:hypothetical protein